MIFDNHYIYSLCSPYSIHLRMLIILQLLIFLLYITGVPYSKVPFIRFPSYKLVGSESADQVAEVTNQLSLAWSPL